MPRISKPYMPRIDMNWKNKIWCTGTTRRLTEKEAAPLLKAGRIYEADMRPKRFVILNGVKMTWGEYLKYRYAAKRTK